MPNLWDASAAPTAPLDALRYRSNLLGADLRITNFAGGNTSAKYDGLLAVKGSGSDLGSITNAGFARLHQHKLDALKALYRGVDHEDELVAHYPNCAADASTVRTSIDTPLHAYLPFPHIDHLHPESVIALAASANGIEMLAEFNRRHHRHLIWIPWLRPGFELGLTLARAVALAARHNQPCDGLVLASHGLFTWGDTSQACYEQSLAIINEMMDFIAAHHDHEPFGGPLHTNTNTIPPIENTYPHHHFTATPEVLAFCNSRWAPALCAKGTSCPDHFLRTKVEALYLAPDDDPQQALSNYRERYTAYYHAHREPDSPALRDPNPTVVVAAGVGLFTYGPSAHEARITSEFFQSTINVMAGATALGGLDNYLALPPREAFRIEYWSLEEAKLRDRKMATALPGA